MLPLSEQKISSIMDGLNIRSLSGATIRQIVAVANQAEKEAQEDFLHLEVGNPGLPPNTIGVEAEIAAIKQGVASIYPPIMGVTSLKDAGSRFLKAFFNVDIEPRCIVPSVGSMQGSFGIMTLLKMRDPKRDTMLFLDPGFPPNKLQAKIIGLKIESIDIYDYRGDVLEAKLEELLSKGNINGIIYSNPNNPAWTNFTEAELEIIGRLATKYDVIVLEDLAYLGMDFRTDWSEPFVGPYIPTVAKYTSNYILLISGSKIFSYAGQRIAFVCMSTALADRCEPNLRSLFGFKTFGDAYIFGIVYTLSSGVAHSAQYALAAMLNASVDGNNNFIEDCREYERRAVKVRKAFQDVGFHLVYATDIDVPVSDGFFFTAGYKKMNSEELQRGLMRYGIASIALQGTGSLKNGIRVCVSKITSEQDIATLTKRLNSFVNEFR